VPHNAGWEAQRQHAPVTAPSNILLRQPAMQVSAVTRLYAAEPRSRVTTESHPLDALQSGAGS
jgi:hypothetical protein